MKLIQHLGYLVLLIFVSCAQQVAPTGGGKDAIPPKIIGSKPANKTTRFDAEKISIKFDEYIQIKDPNQITISPLLADKPQIDAIGKSIEIVFGKSKPEPNTTYTINFGNSIADVNEGNILSNNSYVFSTGDVLDSNRITGQIRNAFRQKPEKDIVVGLYNTKDFRDTLLHKVFPNYFGKSSDSGTFVIENLPNNSFYLICFKDQNADNKYQKNEDVAFGSDIINTGDNNENIQLNLFTPDLFKPNTVLDSISRQKGKYQFAVYRGEEIKIKPQQAIDFYTQFVRGKNDIDTLDIYIPALVDSAQAKFVITTPDSNYSCTVKTKAKSKLPIFTISIEEPARPGDSVYISSTVPIKELPLQLIELIEDTNKIKTYYSKAISAYKWVVYYPFKEGVSYQVILNDSIATNVYGTKNKKTSATFIGKSTKDFGNLLLNISSLKTKGIILQLIEDNNDELVVAEFNSPFADVLQINNLKAGNYRIKLIEDKNLNGKWDNGNFPKRVQAERVHYKKEQIIIKAYWDIEQSVSIENIINN
jgi:hypothetical protein